jgi:hypothetical protein
MPNGSLAPRLLPKSLGKAGLYLTRVLASCAIRSEVRMGLRRTRIAVWSDRQVAMYDVGGQLINVAAGNYLACV